MALISDGLLLAAALTAAIYCHVLAGRLKRLRSLDGGVGQAVTAMSAQVDEMRAALKAAKAASGESTRTLAERTARAEMAAGRLELLLAALHDREGTAPVDLAARRAAAPRPTPVSGTTGGGTTGAGGSPDIAPARPRTAPAAAPASGLRAAGAAQAGPDPAEDEAPIDRDAAPEPEAESAPDAHPEAADPESDAAETGGHAAETGDEAPPDAPAERRPARRLFRIEKTPAAEPAEGADETAALRAALAALARETAE